MGAKCLVASRFVNVLEEYCRWMAENGGRLPLFNSVMESVQRKEIAARRGVLTEQATAAFNACKASLTASMPKQMAKRVIESCWPDGGSKFATPGLRPELSDKADAQFDREVLKKLRDQCLEHHRSLLAEAARQQAEVARIAAVGETKQAIEAAAAARARELAVKAEREKERMRELAAAEALRLAQEAAGRRVVSVTQKTKTENAGGHYNHITSKKYN